jgi:hypothetical protein
MLYATRVGDFIYASRCTRPNITASVNYQNTYMSHPHVEHWLQAKRILRYLKDPLDKGLMLNRNAPYTPVSWQDSSFADGLM